MFYLLCVWEQLSLPPSGCDVCCQFLVLLACFCSLQSLLAFTQRSDPLCVSLLALSSIWTPVHSNEPILSWLYLKYPISKSGHTHRHQRLRNTITFGGHITDHKSIYLLKSRTWIYAWLKNETWWLHISKSLWRGWRVRLGSLGALDACRSIHFYCKMDTFDFFLLTANWKTHVSDAF